MKTLQLILFAAIILLATSCKKDKDGNSGNYRVKHALYGTGQSATYSYNNKNQITRIDYSDGTFERAVYNSAGWLTTYESGGLPNPSHNYVRDYVYNAAGIIQEEITAYGNGIKGKIIYTIANSLQTGYKYYNWTAGAWVEYDEALTTFTYNGANQLIKSQNPSGYSVYAYDEKGNANDIKFYFMNSGNSGFYLASTTVYTFDDKRMPATDIIKSKFRKNNVLDVVGKAYAEDGMINSQYSSTCTYEYNELGHVTKTFINGVLNVTYTLEKI